MTDFLFGKPERDPDLRDARRLSVRESNRPWWEWTSSWARLALPAGAAVAMASALLLTQVDVPVSIQAAADSVTASSLLVSAGDEAIGGALLDQVLVPAEQDWLFSEAMVSSRPEL